MVCTLLKCLSRKRFPLHGSGFMYTNDAASGTPDYIRIHIQRCGSIQTMCKVHDEEELQGAGDESLADIKNGTQVVHVLLCEFPA